MQEMGPHVNDLSPSEEVRYLKGYPVFNQNYCVTTTERNTGAYKGLGHRIHPKPWNPEIVSEIF